MMFRSLLFFGLLASWANPALAGMLTVRVVGADGRPVPNVVVALRPAGQASPTPARGTFRIEQRNTQFHPFISIVPVNADVSFPNFDPFKHHVYSFSATKPFDLKLFAREQNRTVRFDKAGVVAVGCNIHDQMSAYIYVTDTAWTALTDANGVVAFRDAPERTTTIAVWHPYLRAPNGIMSRSVALSSARHDEAFAIRLRPPLQHMSDY
jgi:plastocyanin